MPKRLDELYECKLCGMDFGNSKSHYERHVNGPRHKEKMNPDLAKQLIDNKRIAKERKLVLKQRALEEELETLQLEAEIKEQMIEAAVPEHRITHSEMINTSEGMRDFQYKLTLMGDVLQDYCDIYNGVKSFQEIFKRDFSSLYKENKVVVIDKECPHKGYWINNKPGWAVFLLTDKSCNGLTRILECVSLYHKILKENASEIGFKTEKFELEEIDKKELEEWIKDEITFLYNHKG